MFVFSDLQLGENVQCSRWDSNYRPSEATVEPTEPPAMPSLSYFWKYGGWAVQQSYQVLERRLQSLLFAREAITKANNQQQQQQRQQTQLNSNTFSTLWKLWSRNESVTRLFQHRPISFSFFLFPDGLKMNAARESLFSKFSLFRTTWSEEPWSSG